jgi:hypothetical protein
VRAGEKKFRLRRSPGRRSFKSAPPEHVRGPDDSQRTAAQPWPSIGFEYRDVDGTQVAGNKIVEFAPDGTQRTVPDVLSAPTLTFVELSGQSQRGPSVESMCGGGPVELP